MSENNVLLLEGNVMFTGKKISKDKKPGLN